MKKLLAYCAFIFLISSVLFNFHPTATSAGFWDGLMQTRMEIGYGNEPDEGTSLYEKIGVGFITEFLGITFLGIMIYAGIAWMMARGNAQEVERAKNIIIYAVIGLAVVLGAYVITKLAVILWREV